jgi:hypothetical protein
MSSGVKYTGILFFRDWKGQRKLSAFRDMKRLLVSPVFVLFSLCFAAFALLTISRVHCWSLAPIESIIAGKPVSETIFGQQRGVRSDDFIVWLPVRLAQVLHDPPFPIVNEDIGESLVAGFPYPTNHWTSFFKPSIWGYFFGVDIGLTWDWWFPVFFLFLASFSFFRVIQQAEDRIQQPILWAVAVTSMPMMVYWSFLPAISLASVLAALAVIISLFRLQSTTKILLKSVLLSYIMCVFLMFNYTDWQFSLSIAAAAFLIGFIVDNRKTLSSHSLKIAFGYTSLAVIVALGITSLWLIEAWPIISKIMATENPGKRLDLGGTFSFTRLFSNYFLLLGPFPILGPTVLSNESEAASTFFFFPLLWVVVIVLRRRDILRSSTFVLLSAVIMLGLAKMFLVWPEWLATKTMMGKISAHRWPLAMAFADIVLIQQLVGGKLNQESFLDRFPIKRKLICITIWVGFVALCALLLKKYLGNIENWRLILGFSSAVLLGSIVLFRHQFLATAVACVMMISSLGFLPIVKSDFTQLFSSEVGAKMIGIDQAYSKKSRWLVFNTLYASAALRAIGLETLNGAHFYPHLEIWEKLDPENQFTKIYNRFAYLWFKDSERDNPPVIELSDSPSHVTVYIHPTHNLVKELGVTHILYLGNEKFDDLSKDSDLKHLFTFSDSYHVFEVRGL